MVILNNYIAVLLYISNKSECSLLHYYAFTGLFFTFFCVGYSRSPLTLTAIIVGVTVGLVAIFVMMPFCIVFAFVMCN